MFKFSVRIWVMPLFQRISSSGPQRTRPAHLQKDESISNNADETNFNDFIFPGPIIAYPETETSNDAVWFMKVVRSFW